MVIHFHCNRKEEKKTHIDNVIMFIYLFTIFVLILVLLYKLADQNFTRTLAFNSDEHTPVYTSDESSSSSSDLVCVFGWGGSTRRQLRRLLEFYAEKRIPTISWINPMHNYIFDIDPNHIEQLAHLLLDKSQHVKRIFFHLHSNNGTLTFGHLFVFIQKHDKYRVLHDKIHGIIFDSAPFVVHKKTSRWLLGTAIGNSRAAVSILLNRAQYFHFFWTPLIIFYLLIRFIFKRYFSSDNLLAEEKIRQFLTIMPIHVKQLFIYSQGDRLIPPKIIGRKKCLY